MELNAKTIMNRLQKETELLKPITPENSKKLKTVLVGMLSDLQQVCMDNDIDVMLAYGSALGAVRHKGFIPWDDDLDVYLTREDWNKFKCLFDKELGDKYILEGPNCNELPSKNTFAKIYLKNTKLIDIYDYNTPYVNGIYIDVFVLDFVSASSLVRRVEGTFTNIVRFAINSITYYEYPNDIMNDFMNANIKTKCYLAFRKFLGFLFSIRSHNIWCNSFDNYYAKKKDTGIVTCPTQQYLQEVMDLNDILPATEGYFEGIKVKLPRNLNKYLNQLYGSTYMELPPVEKRETHMVVDLDFGKY